MRWGITACTPTQSRSGRPRRSWKCSRWPGERACESALEISMKLSEALKLVQGAAGDEEVDAILVELLRAPSPQTEKLEADPNLRAYVRDVVAPRLETLTGAKPEIDGMGNLLLRMGGERVPAQPGLLLMGYAMTFPPASM